MAPSPPDAAPPSPGRSAAADPCADKAGNGALGGLAGTVDRVARYVREVRNEARKVIWLSRRQTFTYTAVVVVACAVLAAFMYGFDVLLTAVAKGFVALV